MVVNRWNLYEGNGKISLFVFIRNEDTKGI